MRNRNGFGGVSKLSGNRRKPFVARITDTFTDDGVQVYKTLGYFATYEEALAELVKHHQTNYDIDLKKLTFAEVYNDWSDSHFKDISQTSVSGYKSAYNKCKDIHNIRFADLRKVHLQKVIDNIDSYSMRKSVRVLLNVLYKYAYDNDITEKSYSKTINIGKPVKVHEKIPFSDEEIKILWENVDKIKNVDLVLYLIYTCCRVNEMLHQENEKIHLDENYMIRWK